MFSIRASSANMHHISGLITVTAFPTSSHVFSCSALVTAFIPLHCDCYILAFFILCIKNGLKMLPSSDRWDSKCLQDSFLSFVIIFHLGRGMGLIRPWKNAQKWHHIFQSFSSEWASMKSRVPHRTTPWINVFLNATHTCRDMHTLIVFHILQTATLKKKTQTQVRKCIWW